MIRLIALLNSSAEINVMIRRLMNATSIAMRSDFRLRLISHTRHNMNFDDVCTNIEVDINDLRIVHHIFVVTHVDHQLILRQSFLIDVSVNYDYRFDEVYVIMINSEFT